MGSLYLWFKAFHIIFVVAWMGGLLVYPRYKLHQLQSQPGQPLFDTMQHASAKLRRIILTPSLIVVWLLGISLLSINPALFSTGWWLWIKLAMVVAMTALHGVFVSLGKQIDQDPGAVAGKKLQLLNELPFLLLIVIVIMVVVRPL